MRQEIEMSAAMEIAAACDQGRTIDALAVGVPRNLASAYAIQDELFRIRSDGGAAGWFASATNRSMLDQLGLKEPYAARWRPGRFVTSPGVIHPTGTLPIALEAEVTFKLARDLPPQDRPYTEREVVDAIESVHPSIEIVISCFTDWMNQQPLNLVAEGGIDQYLIIGDGRSDVSALDLANLDVYLTVNGDLKAVGRTSKVLDGPISVLLWLANHAARRGDGLRAGQMCNTGMCAPVYFTGRGERGRVDFGPLGRVEVSIA